MDRQRHLIALSAALACFAASALAQNPSGLRELGWLAPEGQVEALTTEPRFDRERLFAAAAQSPLAAQYETLDALRTDLLVGEALFNTPLLLGGQAAKAGISCQSCHVNGHGNPHFKFPAISREPGTADTTHSFFSKTLGNGVFDPVPIPDLTRAGKVSHDVAARDLERFIAVIVAGEFSGREPVPGVTGPLATFVRALRISGQSGDLGVEQRSPVRDWADAQMIVTLAEQQIETGNLALASLLFGGARARLLLIYERLLPSKQQAERDWLTAQSRALGDVQVLLNRDDSPVLIGRGLARWEAGVAKAPDFAAIEHQTLYREDVLVAFLADQD